MANPVLSFEQFGFDGNGDKHYSSTILESSQGGKKGNQTQFSGAGDWGGSAKSDYLCSGFRFVFDQGNADDEGFILSKYQQQEDEQQKQSFLDYECLDDLHFDTVPQPIQLCQEEYMMNLSRIPTGIAHLVECKKEGCPFSSTSLGERFMQSFQSSDGISMLSHPFGLSFFGLSEEEIRDMRLAEVLLASVEKVVDQQFEAASRMLNKRDYFSSSTGIQFKELFTTSLMLFEGRLTQKLEESDSSPQEAKSHLI